MYPPLPSLHFRKDTMTSLAKTVEKIAYASHLDALGSSMLLVRGLTFISAADQQFLSSCLTFKKHNLNLYSIILKKETIYQPLTFKVSLLNICYLNVMPCGIFMQRYYTTFFTIERTNKFVIVTSIEQCTEAEFGVGTTLGSTNLLQNSWHFCAVHFI